MKSVYALQTSFCNATRIELAKYAHTGMLVRLNRSKFHLCEGFRRVMTLNFI